jgi:hypothetical protein
MVHDPAPVALLYSHKPMILLYILLATATVPRGGADGRCRENEHDAVQRPLGIFRN